MLINKILINVSVIMTNLCIRIRRFIPSIKTIILLGVVITAELIMLRIYSDDFNKMISNISNSRVFGAVGSKVFGAVGSKVSGVVDSKVSGVLDRVYSTPLYSVFYNSLENTVQCAISGASTSMFAYAAYTMPSKYCIPNNNMAQILGTTSIYSIIQFMYQMDAATIFSNFCYFLTASSTFETDSNNLIAVDVAGFTGGTCQAIVNGALFSPFYNYLYHSVVGNKFCETHPCFTVNDQSNNKSLCIGHGNEYSLLGLRPDENGAFSGDLLENQCKFDAGTYSNSCPAHGLEECAKLFPELVGRYTSQGLAYIVEGRCGVSNQSPAK